MKKITFFLILLNISLFFNFSNTAGLRCTQVLNNDAFFSLESLSATSDYTYTYSSNSQAFIIYYNFCKFTTRTCKTSSSYAVLFQLDENKTELNDTCVHLSSANVLTNFEYDLINEDDPSSGIQLILTGGDSFNETLNYQITFKIFCYKGDLATNFIIDELDQDNNEFIAIGRSNDGCPVVQFSDVYQFILDNKYVFGILSIILGIIECFFGLAMLKPSLFVIGYLSGFGFLMLIFGEFILTPDSSVLLIWILLLIAVLLGAIAGYVATSLPKIGFMGLGLWLGFVLAFIINNLFLYKIEVSPPGLLLYFLMAILGIIFAIMSMCMWRHICIISTSFLGSYLVIRSLSLYIGGYPNELTLDKQIQYKELANVGWQFYVYFIFIIVLTVIGAIVQYRNKRKLGGKYAGDFDNVDDIESIGEKYVEMEALDESRNQKQANSMINEANEEDEDMTSRKTHQNPSSKKANDDDLQILKEEKHSYKEKTSSKSAKTPKRQEKEEIPLKKSFQGDVIKKGDIELKEKEFMVDLKGINNNKSFELKEPMIKKNEEMKKKKSNNSSGSEESESEQSDDPNKKKKEKKGKEDEK